MNWETSILHLNDAKWSHLFISILIFHEILITLLSKAISLVVLRAIVTKLLLLQTVKPVKLVKLVKVVKIWIKFFNFHRKYGKQF